MFLYIFVYISAHTLLINSLNWSSGIGITGTKEIEVLEEGTEELEGEGREEGTEGKEEVSEE